MGTQDVIRSLRTFLDTASRIKDPDQFFIKRGENVLRIARIALETESDNTELENLTDELDEWLTKL